MSPTGTPIPKSVPNLPPPPTEEITPITRIRIDHRRNIIIMHRLHRKPDTLPTRQAPLPTRCIARPERRPSNPERVRIMEDGETHPVARHDMREGDVVRGGEIRHIGGNERVGGAVHFCAGGEGEFEDGGGVSEGVDHAGGHVVGWAIYYEIAEPGLALVEGGVEGRARVEGEQAGEEGGPGGGEKVFGLERRVKMLVPILVRNQEGDGDLTSAVSST